MGPIVQVWEKYHTQSWISRSKGILGCQQSSGILICPDSRGGLKSDMYNDRLQIDQVTTGQLVATVGNTPLVELKSVARDVAPIRILAKTEWFNPGGSVKDRPALNMLLEGERMGRLTPGKIVLDATSGNTGIAYAMFGTAMGYRVRLCLPRNAGPLHQRILRQANDHITHFIAGLGTSGTFTGNGKRLREINPDIRLISFQPDSPMHGLEGLKHMPTSLNRGFYDETLADDNRFVRTEDAQAMARRLAAEEGMLAGLSAGAAVHIVLEVARDLNDGVVVTVLPNNAMKYLDQHFW